MEQPLCPTCGRLLDEHDQHLRLRLPQPVLEALLDDEERAARTWGNDVLMQVQGIGAFVRVLVPVRLSGGFSVTYGAWIGVHPDELRHAWEVWNHPEYMNLELQGVLANMLPPWDLETYLRPLNAAPRSADELPYATRSSDAAMQRVLTNEWEHGPVLNALSVYGERSAS